MALSTKAIKGTKDVLPQDAYKIQYIEALSLIHIWVEITPFLGAKGCKKMNKIKRGLALLLTMILLCTALPISAQAKTTGCLLYTSCGVLHIQPADEPRLIVQDLGVFLQRFRIVL